MGRPIAGGGNGEVPETVQHRGGPGGPDEEESRPWWKFRISKEDLITYGMAIVISYGIRE
jgi:hypothetical protein